MASPQVYFQVAPPVPAPRGRRRRRWPIGLRVAVGLALVPFLLAGTVFSTPAVPAAAAQQPGLRQVDYEHALDVVTQARLVAVGRVAVARSVVASAQLALDRSAGHVLTETDRLDLARGIRLQELRIALAVQQIDESNRPERESGGAEHYTVGSADLGRVTRRLQGMTFGWAANFDSVRRQLAGAVDAVRTAVAAWTAEQARLAAVEAARVAAAAQADAARASAAAARASAPRAVAAGASRVPSRTNPASAASAAAPVLYTKNVWTTGFQSEIDACRGAVDVTGHYGVATIAEHWSCGGSRFPGAGRQVLLSGVRAGTYLVGGVVAVLNAATQGASNIPRGYDLLYQTCINGSSATMSFTALTRIG